MAVAIDENFPALKELHPELLARHWTEAGETEPATAEWQRAGKTAEVRNAFAEALESYRQASKLLELLPQSPERDLCELELATSIAWMRFFTAGFTAPQAIDAIERAIVLAEKSGSLKQLVDLMIPRANGHINSGELRAGAALADRVLELALHEGTAANIGRAHGLQIQARFSMGDLAGAEERFRAGLKFFEDPDFVRLPAGPMLTFGFGSWNAWTLGQANIARQREVRLMTAGDTSGYGRAFSAFYAAGLRLRLREYDQSEVLAAQAMELAEDLQLPFLAALARVALGGARS